MASGGPRQPSNPAPVSGPGALSRRTDGGPGDSKQPIRVPTGGQYGDANQLRQEQQGAPLAASPGGDQPPPGGLLAGLSIPPGVSLAEGTTMPNVPVTDGAASGPGAGPEVLGIPNQQARDMQALAAYLPVFEHMANIPGASDSARNLVRAIKGAL